jgi:membrane peptidoglycan carboxypeptidase
LKRFFIVTGLVFSGGISLVAIAAIYLHYATRADLEYLVRAVNTPPQTSRLDYLDTEGRVFDSETGAIRYLPLRFTEIDPVLNEDLIRLEDRNFFVHRGVDFSRTAKATVDFIARLRLPPLKKSAGGSTITQQLVKNLLGHHERTLSQKVREIFLALRLEASLDQAQAKRSIIASYWNHLFVAHRYRGLGSAERLLFDMQTPRSLSAGERTAVLALVRAPSELGSSHKNATRLFRRIASELAKTGRLAGGEAAVPDSFIAEFHHRLVKLRTRGESESRIQLKTPYARSIQNLFQPEAGDRRLAASHALLKTPRLSALDNRMSGILQKKLGALNTAEGKKCAITGAYMLIRLKDAAVIAASEDNCGEYNELTQARRQVSSTIKPFLYTYAMSSLHLEPSAIFTDKRVNVFDPSGNAYSPGNHYKNFRGPMNLKTALQISANTVSLQLYQKIQPKEFRDLLTIAYARYPGEKVADLLHTDHSLALGTVDLSPSHVGAAYLTLLSGGTKKYPQWGNMSLVGGNLPLFITAFPAAAAPRKVFDPLASEQVREMLTAVLRPEGTGGEYMPESTGLVIQELGAKSGSGPVDTWFVGYSEDLLLVVWLGFRSRLGLRRNFHAATLWYDLFIATLPQFPPRPMEFQPGLVRRYFCAQTGLPPDNKCRRIHSALFRKGN